jgi:hypothetical protein
MRTASSKTEAAAIEAAYEAQVRTLYLALTTNLGDAPTSEQQSVDRFTKGINTAKRARQLALNVMGADVPATAAKPRSRKIEKK